MDKLRRYRRVLRAAATRILASTSQLLQGSEPASSDLLVAIDDLEEKDATLNGLNATIADHLDGKEFEDEISSALKYHDKIRDAITKLRYILEEKYDVRAEKTVRAVPLPTYLIEGGS